VITYYKVLAGFGFRFFSWNEKSLWFQVQSRVNLRHLFEKF
jgi:hypothetical protein